MKKLALAITTLLVLLAFSAPLGAHTDFSSSSPSDGDVLAEPVEEVIVSFTKPVTLTEAGFEVLLPSGEIVEPSAVSADGITWTLSTPDALAGGEVAVRFEVAADEDGHVFTGGFAFTVTAPIATTIPPTTSPPATSTTLATASTTTPATSASTTSATAEQEATEDVDSASRTAEFLEGGRGGAGRTMATIGRVLSFLVALLLIGGVVFSMTSWRQDADDSVPAPNWLEPLLLVGGLLLVAGAVLELTGLASGLNLGFGDLLGDKRLGGARLRLVAGCLFCFAPLASKQLQQLGSLLAIGLAAGSFAFDGHTVSEGPRVLHGLVNASHVLAAGIWFGGLVALALSMRESTKNGRETDAVAMFASFSKVATVALVPVVVGGVTMAVFILDSWGDLTGSNWGRLLIVKLVAVGVAMIFGARHHFVGVPQLASIERDDALTGLGRTLLIEAGVLVLVVSVTAFLVNAAPN